MVRETAQCPSPTRQAIQRPSASAVGVDLDAHRLAGWGGQGIAIDQWGGFVTKMRDCIVVGSDLPGWNNHC